MRRHATTLLLLSIAVALGLWLWIDRDEVTEAERSRREDNVFPAWRREDVSRIEIAHEGETILLYKEPGEDGAWRTSSPREERVDQQAMERLMTTLEFATVVRKVGASAAGSDAQLGLEAPRAAGSVAMGSLRFRFALGAPSPRPEGSSYFRVDDGEPFVASRELTEALLASSDTYRDRTVIPYLSLELARFEVEHPGGGFAVERSDSRSFDAGRPSPAPLGPPLTPSSEAGLRPLRFEVEGLGVLASRVALDKVWSALAEMRAEAFPKDADADRLTERPRLTIRMTSKEQGRPPGELVVGEACPGHPDDVVVLRKQPTRVAACAPKGALEALLAITPEALVDDRPLSFRHDEIEELRLEWLGAEAGASGAAPRAIELARRGTGFHQREPEDRELTPGEADAVSELLAQIERGAADAVRRGGGPFEAVYRARARSGEYEEIVEIGAFPSSPSRANGAPDAPRVLLRRVRDDARLTVSPAVARRLVPRATTVRSRELLTDTRRVERVVLRCGAPQELVDDGSGLRLIEPAGYETDGSIAQLVDGLFRGKVNAWVADADDGSFGLGADGCRVVVAFAGGNAPVTVRFGAEGEGGVYGAVDGRPEVFVAPLSLRELARRIYVSRAALRVDPSRIESVRVSARGRSANHDPAALREAAAGIYADRVVTLASSDVGPVEIEIEIATAEGGATKRVVCGPMVSLFRRCAVSGVRAVFDVHPSNLDGLFEPLDAGAARGAPRPDAGSYGSYR